MSFWNWLLVVHILNDDRHTETPFKMQTDQTAFSTAFLLMLTVIAFFLDWLFIAAFFLGMSAFVFLYGLVKLFTVDSSNQTKRVSRAISFVFLVFSIIAVELCFFTKLSMFSKLIFWIGIGICTFYIIGVVGEHKQKKHMQLDLITKRTKEYCPDAEIRLQAMLLARALVAVKKRQE